MHIVWDEPKRLANLDKHGFDFADLTPAFFLQAMIRPARRARRQAVGVLGQRTISVIYAPLGSEAVSIISMRYANQWERSLIR